MYRDIHLTEELQETNNQESNISSVLKRRPGYGSNFYIEFVPDNFIGQQIDFSNLYIGFVTHNLTGQQIDFPNALIPHFTASPVGML